MIVHVSLAYHLTLYQRARWWTGLQIIPARSKLMWKKKFFFQIVHNVDAFLICSY